ELGEEIQSRKIPNIRLEELSMGMTGDFEVAVEEGATIVRIGTALFGPRG
ncbi:MAG: YggS family pyridoxal phosphate enzyme, partial [Deltaproteobacteria bacterium]|nr:YggS family pyridoxal phosphate enzyme [Deltaproteobacteria bacterium]